MDLKAYLAPLKKWWWLIVASTLIAAVSSYFAVSQQAAIFQARATLLIGSAINNPNPSGNEFWLSQQLAQTYTDIAQREVIQSAVKESLGLTWLPAYTARAVPDTQLIEIIVTDSSPERAMVVANEVAKHLILQAPTNKQGGVEGREEFISEQLDELEIKIGETNDDILSKQDELAGLFSARQIADAQGQISALEAKRNTLQGNYAALLASTSQGAANSLSVIESATIPKIPIGPDVMLTVLTAAAIGFSLAVGAAYLLEYLDDTIKSPSDIQHAVHLPTLTGIADYEPLPGASSSLVTIAQPRTPISEAYRGLRTAVQFSNIDVPVRTVLVTSANAEEGKSYTAANLAVVMAQAGHRVLLVDTDLRRPSQARYFAADKSYGLTGVLVNLSAAVDPGRPTLAVSYLNRGIKQTTQSGLYFLPSGPLPPNPSELVGSTKMKSLLTVLEKSFDYIVLDSPPVLAVTDAVILSARVDAVILVASAAQTRVNQLSQAVSRLQEVNANVIGVVLNRLSVRGSEYGYDYYYRSNAYFDKLEADDTGNENASTNGSAEAAGPVSVPKSSLMNRLLS